MSTTVHRDWRHVYLRCVATLMIGFAVMLGTGGLWLAMLGGSWYYLFAGVGLGLSGAFLWQRGRGGLWLYLLVLAVTIVWAMLERGLTGWPQVPRLLAPTVMLVLILVGARGLRKDWNRGVGAASAMVAIFGVFVIVQTAVGTSRGPTGINAPVAAAGAAPAGQVASDAPGLTMPSPFETGDDWPAYGGTNAALRYSPLDKITPDNVNNLTLAWSYRTGDMPTPEADGKYSPENTPLKVGNRIYVCSAMGMAIALEADTGKEIWRFDPEVSTDAIPYGATCRGMAWFEVPGATDGDLCATRLLWGTLDARLLAVDAATGAPCPGFGQDGAVDLNQGIGETVPGWYSVTSAPTIVRGIAVVGAQIKDGQAEDSPSGVIRGFDAVSGELAWAWDLGNPALTGAPAPGQTYTRGTPNMWTTATGDEALGLVYLPLGNSAVDYYGSNRSEAENTYATALVAIDVATGTPAWHFQTVRHDVWDYDLGGQATLIDYPSADGTIPALVLPSKQGDIYILDRRNGQPLVPVEERPVPKGGVEPEYLSPSQPFSMFHTLAKRDLTEREMWGFTPIDQLWCRIQFRRAMYQGIYTAPTTETSWIQYPGYNGGSDWGGIAVDPVRGLIVANYNDMPNYNRLIPRAEADEAGLKPIYDQGSAVDTPLGEAGPQVGSPYAIQVNAGFRVPFTGLLCKEPPYGGIRAISIATGETVWDRPFGTARKNGPFGIPSFLPFDIGTPNNGGAVVTASGLVFIAAATDDLFRAIDISSGETVWSVPLPAGGQSTPFVFEADGRQFVGLAAGGHHFMQTPIGDYVMAWTLPK